MFNGRADGDTSSGELGFGHLWKADDHQRGSDAEGAGDVERGKVSGEFGACRASAKCRGCRTKLMAGEDPAEDKTGLLRAKALRRKLDGRRHRCHPVEPVEDAEYG